MSRLRVRFSKFGKVRFTSHRDVARIWERSLRRAGIAVAYTEGFSPRPKLSFGLALSTGYESLGEYLDISLREGDDLTLDEAAAAMAPGLPVGMEVQAVVRLEPGADSLQQAVTSCTWHIDLAGIAPDEAEGLVQAALAAGELPVTRERKGQVVTDDVRPGIISAHVVGPAPTEGAPATCVECELATQPRALRPAEFVSALLPPRPAATLAGVDPEGHAPLIGERSSVRPDRVTRISQWTQAGGARAEVIDLPPAATLPPHAEARAS